MDNVLIAHESVEDYRQQRKKGWYLNWTWEKLMILRIGTSCIII